MGAVESHPSITALPVAHAAAAHTAAAHTDAAHQPAAKHAEKHAAKAATQHNAADASGAHLRAAPHQQRVEKDAVKAAAVKPVATKAVAPAGSVAIKAADKAAVALVKTEQPVTAHGAGAQDGLGHHALTSDVHVVQTSEHMNPLKLAVDKPVMSALSDKAAAKAAATTPAKAAAAAVSSQAAPAAAKAAAPAPAAAKAAAPAPAKVTATVVTPAKAAAPAELHDVKSANVDENLMRILQKFVTAPAGHDVELNCTAKYIPVAKGQPTHVHHLRAHISQPHEAHAKHAAADHGAAAREHHEQHAHHAHGDFADFARLLKAALATADHFHRYMALDEAPAAAEEAAEDASDSFADAHDAAGPLVDGTVDASAACVEEASYQ